MKTPVLKTVAIFGLAFFLTACGSDESAETAADESTAAAPEISSNQTSSELTAVPGIADGGIEGLEGETLPADLPLFPDAYAGFKVTDISANEVAVVMQSDVAVASVVDFYKDAMVLNGWEMESDFEDPNSAELIAWKDERKMIVLTLTNNVETLVSVKIKAAEPR